MATHACTSTPANVQKTTHQFLRKWTWTASSGWMWGGLFSNRDLQSMKRSVFLPMMSVWQQMAAERDPVSHRADWTLHSSGGLTVILVFDFLKASNTFYAHILYSQVFFLNQVCRKVWNTNWIYFRGLHWKGLVREFFQILDAHTRVQGWFLRSQ